MLITIINIASGVFTFLAIPSLRRSAPIDDVYAAAVMLLAAGVAQLVAIVLAWLDNATGQLFASAVWAPLALAFAAAAWSRAARMDKASGLDDGEGASW